MKGGIGVQVDVALVPAELPYCPEVSVGVVIDVLRASSTITTALSNGASLVATFAEVEEARGWGAEAEGRLLGGERGALPIEGFCFGNSPLEYTKERVTGRQIGITTTNGTRAVELTLRQARTVLMASLLNIQAIVDYCRGAKDILLVCAGTEGRFSLEDAYCAGMILDRLGEIKTTDSARLVQGIYGQHREREPQQVLMQTVHGGRLLQLGFAKDVEYCGKVDLCPVVPLWDRGERAFVAVSGQDGEK